MITEVQTTENAPAVPSVKTCYSSSELLVFKKIIEVKMEEAQNELNYFSTQLASIDPMRGDGAAMQEKEGINQQAGRQKKFIEQLEAALVRIANGTYGICSVTKKLIPEERLRSVPHTTKTIEAKLRLN